MCPYMWTNAIGICVLLAYCGLLLNTTVIRSVCSQTTWLIKIGRLSLPEDWLEMKMEIDSPEPDRSPTPLSSPELLANGSRSSLILTPPAAFADCSLHHSLGHTPQDQIRSTPHILTNCGGTFTIPGRLAPQAPLAPVLEMTCSITESGGRSSPRDVSRSQSQHNTTNCVRNPEPCVVVTSAPAMGHRPYRGTPMLATASFGLRTPGSDRRTPTIVVTDSVMGNSTFAARYSFSSQQQPGANTSRRTPSLLVSDSVLGNSTFGVQSATTHRTPDLLVTNSVLGNSTFGVQSTFNGSSAARAISDSFQITPSIVDSNCAHQTPSVLNSNCVQRTPSILNSNVQRTPCVLDSNCVSGTSSVIATPCQMRQVSSSTPQTATNDLTKVTPSTAGSSLWPAPSMNVSEDPRRLSSCPTPQQGSRSRSLAPHHVDTTEVEMSEQLMEVTSGSPWDELAECCARMDSFKHSEKELKDELGRIKDQFFVLLTTLGLSHDVYYNAVTPDDTPETLRSRLHESILSLAQHQGSININNNYTSTLSPPSAHSSVTSRRDSKSQKMSTPRTPRRRNHGRQHGVDTSSKYADLVLEQLLAKARSQSNSSSSKSSSPQDPAQPDEVSSVAGVSHSSDHGAVSHSSDHGAVSHSSSQGGVSHTSDQGHSQRDDLNTALLPDSVNVNRGSGSVDAKDSAMSKVIPTFSFHTLSASELTSNGVDLTLPEHPAGSADDQGLPVPAVTPEALLSSTSSSGPTSSNGSSSNTSVPDLDKELVSRMQYYSDFTIDRQKKIEERQRVLGTVPEVSDSSSSPASTVPEQQSSGEHISPRCVEGSDSVNHFKRPLPPKKPLVRARRSDTDESDTSSGTGSMSGSKSSHPSSRRSSHSSKPSSRPNSRSSSSHSSRSSRCSTHPLASSTFISDPSGGSPGSGSVYTWSLDNSSDENLQQSFLRSAQKRKHKSRRRRRSSHSSSVIDSSVRPETVIGADSPPHDKLFDTTLHLSHDFSDMDTTPRRFGGNRFENSMRGSVVRSSSMPRTSTRIGAALMVRGDSIINHKTSSSPELSNPCSQLNDALSRIGPSNLSSDLQQPSTDRSSSMSFRERPDLPGKSSTSDSTTSYHSQCLTCNPGLATTLASGRPSGDEEDACDDILTNSPKSYEGSGMQPPCNSYVSPADSSNDYTTVSDSSADQSIVASAPRQPRAFANKGSVFKVPFSPGSRTVKRKALAAGGQATNSVGVRTMGTPHFPVGPHRHKETVSRRKLFASGTSQLAGTSHHAPKILDRKALVRKFMKFSSNFKKDKSDAKIHTLANL